MTLSQYHLPLIINLFLLSLTSSKPHVSKPVYNHLQLVYTWPNTFCTRRHIACRIPVPQNFTLHGLWPADRTGKPVMYCSKSGNISLAISRYEKQLASAWGSLRRDVTNRQFWEYQWDKHGACTLRRMNASRYLQIITSQQGKIDLTRALSSHGIVPNDGFSYPRSAVEAAIGKEIRGRNFYISCQNYRRWGDLIHEIYVCLDSDGRKVVSCPKSDKPRGCGRSKQLVFPGNRFRL